MSIKERTVRAAIHKKRLFASRQKKLLLRTKQTMPKNSERWRFIFQISRGLLALNPLA